jgi:hypothetical protein
MTSKVTSRGRGRNGGRPGVSPAQPEAADPARGARIAALHEQIGERVETLVADPAWRAMLETAARFHAYSLNNQMLIALGAAAQGFSATRVAGYTTWKSLGRSVVKGSRGLAILAPCTYRTTPAAGAGRDAVQAAAIGGGGEGTGPEAVAGVLAAHSLSPAWVDGRASEISAVRLAQTANRSAVGVMNEFGWLADNYRPGHVDDLVGLSGRLVATPMRAALWTPRQPRPRAGESTVALGPRGTRWNRLSRSTRRTSGATKPGGR